MFDNDLEYSVELTSYLKTTQVVTLQALLEVFAVLQCFEEMSSKICLRDREQDAAIRRAISGSRAKGSRPLVYTRKHHDTKHRQTSSNMRLIMLQHKCLIV